MRTKIGVITSAKMQKTVTVTVHRYVMHDKYSKRYRVSKKFLADTNGHDDLSVGDEVQITECRPLSKRKSFQVTQIRKKALKVAQFRDAELEKHTKRDHRDTEYEKAKATADDSTPSA
jgi:small subunit ribosomal protein S17